MSVIPIRALSAPLPASGAPFSGSAPLSATDGASVSWELTYRER